MKVSLIMSTTETFTLSETFNVNGTAYPYRPEIRATWMGLPSWFNADTSEAYPAHHVEGFYSQADRNRYESAAAIRDEAYRINDEYRAVEVVESLADRDARAAQAQAEVLGATADQRAKLRQIVEERQAAQAEVTRLAAEVTRLGQPITDAEDTRVLGLFASAAEEADRQGYCSTYEQIAGAVGIPGRDRLRELGALPQRRFRFEVRVTAYVTVDAEGDNESDAWDNADVDEAIADSDPSWEWGGYNDVTEVTDEY